MCSQATCSTCNKTTWRGCGSHVDAVMANVPTARRCTCERAPKSGGFFSKLFAR